MNNPLQKLLKSILLIFIFSFLLCLNALPQNQRLVDSLKNVIARGKDDAGKAELLIKIGELYNNSNPD